MSMLHIMIMALLLSTVGCTEEAALDFVPYAAVAGVIVLVRFFWKLSTAKPDTPSRTEITDSDLVKQTELHEKSPAYKEHLARLDAFLINDPAFDADKFLKWVDNDIIEYIHKIYSIDPLVHHAIMIEYRSLTPEKKAEIDRYYLSSYPLEYLRPYCTEEMIQQLEKELGSDCGRITRKVIDGGGHEKHTGLSAVLRGSGAYSGKTYRWCVHGDRFTMTKIYQEAGMDHIMVHEQREVSERKYEENTSKSVCELETLRFLLEECDYTFSRPSGSKDWRLSSKGTKLVTERREGMHKEGYTMPE